MSPLLVFGVVLLGLGLRIADAPGGGPVEIIGRLVAGDHGTIGEYGTEPTTRLVLFAGDGPGAGELLVSNKSERELLSRMLRGFVIAVVMTVVGAGLTVGGLLAG
jgi:hypothetical protein